MKERLTNLLWISVKIISPVIYRVIVNSMHNVKWLYVLNGILHC